MLGAKIAHICARDGFRQRTTCPHVRHQNGFVRAEQFRGFRHEMHATLHDDRGFGNSCLLGEIQAISYHVRHPVIDFGCLIIVSKYDRVFFFFQRIDGLRISRV
jgi:hypothetical protein